MLDKKIRDLAINVALNKPAAEFSTQDLHEALRAEMAALVTVDGVINHYQWEQNKQMIFEIMATMMDEVMPIKVGKILERFADIKSFRNGDKPRFTVKKGMLNVKRFVTRVAIGGKYERVRLDRDYFDVETYAHGGAVYQSLEGFLTNRESITEVLDLLLQGIEDSIYSDFVTTLNGTYSLLPAANKHTAASFVAADFNRILATVSAYGQPVIFCGPEFAATIVNATGYIGTADQADVRNQGYLGRYMGADIVVLPQSFTDATNTVKTLDPGFAYIFPAGANEKPVKIAFEGTTMIRQENKLDWSVEIQAFKKIGMTVVHTNFYGIYENTALV